MFDFNAKGYYSWVVLNEKDRVVRYAPTQSPNLILNQGLNGIAERPWAASFVICAVGTGDSTPNAFQTGLDGEVQRTSTYLNLESANSTVLVGNVYKMRRTFVFPKEGGSVTYNEAGFGYGSGPGNLFSRVKLPSVVVEANERLIIQYELLITITPNSPVELSNPVTGKISEGVFCYQYVGLKGVNALGQVYDYDIGEGCNEPALAAKVFLSSDSSSPAAFGSAISRTGTVFIKDATLSTYSPLSFSRKKSIATLKKEGMGSWRSLGLGGTVPQEQTGLVFVFDNPFSKQQGILTLDFTYTWGTTTKSFGEALYYYQTADEMTIKVKNPPLYYWSVND